MSAEEDEGVVEAPLDGPDGHGSGEVDGAVGPAFELPAVVEFAEHAGPVACVLEDVADRLLAGEELRECIPTPRAAGDASAPV